MTAAVDLREVRRSFGSVEVLTGITIQVEPGVVVAVYGRSGSGKTTLLNLIGGLDRPTAGSIALDGQDLAALGDGALDQLRRTRLAFVFQSYGLLSHLTARENVEFGLRLAGRPRPEWLERIDWSLNAVGLSARAKHRPAELSGGERQRVAIARALAVRPRLVLADEPTGALDHATGLQIIDLLAGFARETGATVWIATHDASVRTRVDMAYRITAGRLALEGS